LTTSSLASTATPRPRFAFAPQAALLALLIAEVLYLTISFDTKTLDRAPDAWAQLIGWAPQLLRLAIAVAGLTVLLAGRTLLSVLERNAGLNPRWAYFLAGHLLAVALFSAVTSIVMGAAFPSTSHQGTWALGWLLAGVLTLGLWALTIWSPSAWLEAAREGGWALVWGSVAGTAVWGTGFVTEEFWRPLAGYTFAVVRWMVGLIYARTFADPSRLEVGTPAFSVSITPQCSGYEGIGLIVAFLGVYLWLSRRTLRFPNALLLLPIGAAAVWILNSVRIATLIVIGTSGWPEIALGGFHSQAGWLAFNAVGLGLVAITIRGRYFATTTVRDEAIPGDPDATAAYLGPFLAIVAASMITGAMSAGFDWLYPVRVIAVAAVLWTYRRRYTALRWSWSWQAIAIGAVTFIIWLALMPAGADAKAGWPATLGAINPVPAGIWLAIRVLGYVVLVPVAEELAFRGFALARLERVDFQNATGDFAWLPWIVSSVLFGAMHGSMWLAGSIAGLLFGLALFRRRSLGDAVQAHATTNLLLVIYAVTTGRWSAWS
jgi:exosortase E/protease (VPEID-CTERM system)